VTTASWTNRPRCAVNRVPVINGSNLFELSNTTNPGALTPQQQRLGGKDETGLDNLRQTRIPVIALRRDAMAGFQHSPQMLSVVPPQTMIETDFAAEHNCAFWANLG